MGKFLCIVHLGALSYLSLLFFGVLHSDGYNKGQKQYGPNQKWKVLRRGGKNTQNCTQKNVNDPDNHMRASLATQSVNILPAMQVTGFYSWVRKIL